MAAPVLIAPECGGALDLPGDEMAAKIGREQAQAGQLRRVPLPVRMIVLVDPSMFMRVLLSSKRMWELHYT